ncbi:unnamed protein product [Didymodactylos carnosus]|uniref:Uncharacterized protein n=1 Tax=Didymodactylos carnosus TaxID=1234261 RepID=A0A815WZ88_9BILA|nr:unnamed protein product [Didymodactylos carnosus]CAF1549776.1 unnamed protein product [Didymodactylos carnosus]CAF4324442.1 unnamed protein product [Didymodactylos carnosus]CAF4410692.1 unnamed protein product [Didymodactylos carnosus]
MGKLEEIPIFPVAKRPRTGTPHPSSQPPMHRYFVPFVASSPIAPRLPTQLKPTTVTIASPPCPGIQSTITLAPTTALPPRTTTNGAHSMTTTTTMSSWAILASTQQLHLNTTNPVTPTAAPPQQSYKNTIAAQKPSLWMIPGKSRKSSASSKYPSADNNPAPFFSVESVSSKPREKKQRFQIGTTSNFNSYTNIPSYIPPPIIPPRRRNIGRLMPVILPLMDLELRRPQLPLTRHQQCEYIRTSNRFDVFLDRQSAPQHAVTQTLQSNSSIAMSRNAWSAHPGKPDHTRNQTVSSSIMLRH